MITSRQMWRADNHQTTNITIRRYVAHFRRAAWAEKSLALDLRMAHAQARRGRVRETRGEAHHHQVCGGVCPSCTCTCSRPCGSGNGALGRGGDELKEEVFEVSVIEGNAELA